LRTTYGTSVVVTEPECKAGPTEDVVASRYVGDLNREIIAVVNLEADNALILDLFLAEDVFDAALKERREMMNGWCG
jgi:hypothetical protein